MLLYQCCLLPCLEPVACQFALAFSASFSAVHSQFSLEMPLGEPLQSRPSPDATRQSLSCDSCCKKIHRNSLAVKCIACTWWFHGACCSPVRNRKNVDQYKKKPFVCSHFHDPATLEDLTYIQWRISMKARSAIASGGEFSKAAFRNR